MSFAQKREVDLLAMGWDSQGWILDSGAFTFWRLGTPVDFGAYMDLCHRVAPIVDGYVAMDVIGDPDGTWLNYVAMREVGLSPIPVYHEGEPVEWLDRYVSEVRGGVIGLGGTVSRGRPELIDWLIPLFQRHPDQKFHGLGMTQERIIRWLPFYSVDSTSWLNFQRYGVEANKYLLKNRTPAFMRRLGIACLEDVPKCPPDAPPSAEGQLLAFQRDVKA